MVVEVRAIGAYNVIAIYSGTKGGTRNTIEYAMQKGIEIYYAKRVGNATCKQRRTTLEYPTGRMISANTSSRSISKSPTSFIWKQSGDVLRARAQVPSRACCGQKKASENQQKQPRRSQMLASVAHQCLQRIRSPQNAALEICAKCLQFANAAFF